MTTFSSDPANPERPSERPSPTALPTTDDALGWEGHVNVPPAPVFANLLNNWPELRSGLAFCLVFVAGAVVGGSLVALSGCSQRRAPD